MIKDFNRFYEEALFESIINETFIYYVKDFKDVLYKLSSSGNTIAKELIDIEYKDNKSDNTFISLGKDGYVSYNRLRDLKRNIEKSFTEWAKSKRLSDENTQSILDTLLKKIENGETSQSDVNHLFKEYELDKKSRNEVKLGRFVNAVLPGKFTPKDIEEFTNQFKATLEKSGERFEIVEGDDIDFWYSSSNYKENSGTLGNSCMAHKSGYFGLYTENPEVCKMLVLLEDDKLIGRALVWKLDSIKRIRKDVEVAEWFMDRQYTIKDSDVEKFRNYAKEKGWAYKSYNNHHSFSPVIFNGEEFNADMTVRVKSKKYPKYPYMDTFRRFDKDSGMLYNNDDMGSEYEGQYILNSTSGGYEEIQGGVWSEWHDRMIPEDEAIWSDWADSYLYRDDAVYVSIGSRRWRDSYYPADCDDIVYDEWIDEYLHIDDTVYSEAYGYSLYDQNAVEVIGEILGDGDIDNYDNNYYHKDDNDIIELYSVKRLSWYKFLSEKWSNWEDYEYILKSEMTEDSKGNYIPKILKRKIYKVTEPKDNSFDLMGIDYLLKEDAISLDWEINESDEMIIDIVQYNLNIEEVISELKNRLDYKINQLKSIISGDGRIKFEEDEEDYIRKVKSLKSNLEERLEELEEEMWHEDLA
jgi:hypothetical protein